MKPTPINCWEVKQCGREPGGVHSADLGVCPASSETAYDGVNDGHNGGRFCWAVAGTLCNGQVQGTFAFKAMDCMKCAFYAQVVREHHGRPILNPAQLR